MIETHFEYDRIELDCIKSKKAALRPIKALLLNQFARLLRDKMALMGDNETFVSYSLSASAIQTGIQKNIDAFTVSSTDDVTVALLHENPLRQFNRSLSILYFQPLLAENVLSQRRQKSLSVKFHMQNEQKYSGQGIYRLRSTVDPSIFELVT